jgi:hypothetical protein
MDPFRASLARRRGSRWTSLESGSGIGFHLCLTLLPSIALPVARTVAILADVRHFRGGSGQKLSSVSGAAFVGYSDTPINL